MKLNLKDWKKVSQDEHNSTFKDKDGHSLTVAHKALTPAMRKQLANLPVMMAEGGEVPAKDALDEALARPANASSVDDAANTEVSPAELDPAAARKRELYNQAVQVKQFAASPDPLGIGGVPDPSPSTIGPAGDEPAVLDTRAWKQAEGQYAQEQADQQAQAQQAQKAQASQAAARQAAGLPADASAAPVTPPANVLGATPQPGAAPAATGQPDASNGVPSMMGMMEAYQRGAQQQIAGHYAEANALGAAGKAQAEVAQQAAHDQQAALQTFQQHESALDQERQHFQSDLANSHIDPNHYMGSMDTGQRFSTAIGLILGGIGAGGLGQENPAMKFINQQIDRDIAAQQSNINVKSTLLSANLQQFGNLRQATEMTRIMMNDIVLDKLKAAEAKAQDPIAKARAQQAAGKIISDTAVQQRTLAGNVTLGNLEAQIAKDPTNAERYIRQMQVFDPKRADEVRDRLVPGLGIASTKEGAKEVMELKSTTDTAKGSIKRLLDINAMPGKSISPQIRAEAETVSQTLIGALRKPIIGPGVMNENEINMLNRIVANPTNMLALDSSNKTRLNSLVQRLDASLASTAQAHGLHAADPISTLPPQQQAFAQWAKQNPQDPRSAAILQKLGIK